MMDDIIKIDKIKTIYHRTSDDFPICCGNAPVKRVWNQNHYVLNGYPAGLGWSSDIHWECAGCGKRLEPNKRERTDLPETYLDGEEE